MSLSARSAARSLRAEPDDEIQLLDETAATRIVFVSHEVDRYGELWRQLNGVRLED